MKNFNLNPYTKKKNIYEEKIKTEQLTEEELKHYRYILYLYNRSEKQSRSFKAMVIYGVTVGIVVFINNYNYKLSLFTFICAFIYITYKNYQIKHKLSKPRKNEWYQYIVFWGISSIAIFPAEQRVDNIYFNIYFWTVPIYSILYGKKAYQYGKKDNGEQELRNE